MPATAAGGGPRSPPARRSCPGALIGGVVTFGSLARARRGHSRRRGPASRTWWRPRSRSRRPPPRPEGCESCRRSAASFRRGGDGRCRCRSPRRSTASCSGSGSPPSCSASASGRWRGSASRLAIRGAGLLIGAAFGVGRAIPVLAVAPAVDTRARDSLHRADGRAAGALPRVSARGRPHPGPGGRGAHGHHRHGGADRGAERLRPIGDAAGRWPSSVPIGTAPAVPRPGPHLPGTRPRRRRAVRWP